MSEDIEYCDCGRTYCQFFDPSEGEYGSSYSIAEVEEYLTRLPKLKKHLQAELAKAKTQSN